MASVILMQFAKVPCPGEVKTRLIPALGSSGAYILHQGLMLETFNQLHQMEGVEYQLWLNKTMSNAGDGELWNSMSLEKVFIQQGKDLGERMGHALQQALKQADYALLVGSDCPLLDANYIAQAIGALDEGVKVVLGPAEDGGYVLIGVRDFHPQLMQDISWGSNQVLSETRARLDTLGWQHAELPKLWDVDRPEDIARLEAIYGALEMDKLGIQQPDKN